MYLNAGTDTGDIIDQRHVPIAPGDTCASVYTRVAEAGATMLRHHLPAILDGTAPRRSQGPADGDLLPQAHSGHGHHGLESPCPCGPRLDPCPDRTVPGGVRLLGGHKVMLWASAVPGDTERRSAPVR